MSITNYPDADFTPDIPNSGANTGKQSYNPTGSFRFWAQKVLPTVYDDSLSYYEILTKVVNYLNAVIQNVDSLNDSVDNTNSAFDTLQGYVNGTKDTIVSAYNELQGYVNNYFDSLDVQEEINTKLDAMASDGSLSKLLAPFIPSLVSDWLSKNITPTSPAIDASLSVSGAGADAKVTGEQIADVKSDLKGSGEFSFASKAVTEETVIPKDFDNVTVNGCKIYTDKSGAIHVKGTVNSSGIIGYRISENFTTSDVTVHARLTDVNSECKRDDVNIGIWDGSTPYDVLQINVGGTAVKDLKYTGASKQLSIYLYCRDGKTYDFIITFATETYKGAVLAPYSKVLDKRVVLENHHIAVSGGDLNFLADIGVPYDTWTTMPYISNLTKDKIDFENGVIDLTGNHLCITPLGYTSLAKDTISYPVNDQIQYITYNFITHEYGVPQSSYNGGDTVLFGIWNKQIISPWNYYYEHINTALIGAFPIKGEIIDAATINIDTTEQTLSITTCVFMLGKCFVNKGNVTVDFTYNADYAHFVYYDGANIQVVVETAETGTNGYNAAFQKGYVPLFYFYSGKMYGLHEGVKAYIDGVQVHGADATLDSQLASQKIAYLGDSLTQGVGAGNNPGAYPRWIADKLGCTCLNHGLSGSAIVENGQSVDGFIERVSNIPSDCTIVAFMGGTNDYWQNQRLGTYGDTTPSTFYGALDVLINALQNRFPTAFIYAVVPPMGWQPDNDFDMETKSQIGSFEDVATAIKKMAAKYALPVLDLMHDSSLNPKNNGNKAAFFSDGVHLNVAGEKALASAHIGFLRSHYRMTW